MLRENIRRLLIIIVLLGSPFITEAKNAKKPYVFKQGSELRIGIGYAPFTFYSTNGSNLFLPNLKYNYPINQPNMDDYFNNLGDIFSDKYLYNGQKQMTGAISATYSYRFYRWFELSASVQYSGIYNSIYSYLTGRQSGRYENHFVSVLPTVRFVWYRNNIVSIYSALSLGVAFSSEKYESIDGLKDDSNIRFGAAFNVNYFGISVGKKVYGFCDLSFGAQGLISAGIGFKL